MTTTRRHLTDSVRDARRAEQRELVTAAIDQLRSSEGWQAYLKGRRYFRAYSARNVLMILQQRTTAHCLSLGEGEIDIRSSGSRTTR